MGAAPIPSAGIVLLVMIMETVQVPITSLFGLIIAIDWLYDRPETMVNIVGDSIAAAIIDKYIGTAPSDPNLPAVEKSCSQDAPGAESSGTCSTADEHQRSTAKADVERCGMVSFPGERGASGVVAAAKQLRGGRKSTLKSWLRLPI